MENKHMGVTLTLVDDPISRVSSGMTFPPPLFDGFGRYETAISALRAAPPWVDFVFPVGMEQSTNQITKGRTTEWVGGFIPRTDLGKRLVALRNKAIAAGMLLLDEDEILEEVRRRRGEIEGDEADLH
jgi:hypothetical protein